MARALPHRRPAPRATTPWSGPEYNWTIAAYFAVRAAYRRQHRRLLSCVREFLGDEVVEDVALGIRWSSAWPTLLGIAVLAIGAIFASLRRFLPVVAGLVLGFGLLAIGWIATPGILLVSTANEVFVLEGRRRTYEPVAILERHDRSSWVSDREIATRGLWVGTLWRRHLP